MYKPTARSWHPALTRSYSPPVMTGMGKTNALVVNKRTRGSGLMKDSLPPSLARTSDLLPLLCMLHDSLYIRQHHSIKKNHCTSIGTTTVVHATPAISSLHVLLSVTCDLFSILAMSNCATCYTRVQ
jgi:hypothetical protein